MTRALHRLAAIAGLVRDLRLAELRQAEERRAATLAQLQALSAPVAVEPADLAVQRAALLYEGWAEARRREIAGTLAGQEAACTAARAAAGRALGRARVIDTLAARRGP